MERRLAAILAADLVGYSRLMAADEAGTHAQLKGLRKELVEPTIAEYRGRVVKLTGDGILVEFASVLDAVACAVEVQRGMTERNVDITSEDQLVFRMGVNLGEIIFDEGDIYGDGVNIAARLEGLSEPGGVCISAKVHEEVKHKLGFGYQDLGPQPVKNIPEPVRAYRVLTDPDEVGAGQSTVADGHKRLVGRKWLAVAAVVALLVIATGVVGWLQPWQGGGETGSAALDNRRVAVLPFANISADVADEYFSDGMTEELISQLSKVGKLSVIARTSIMKYKGANQDIAEIGRALRVGTILEGSVRKAGDQLRITAQLIDVASQAHLWSEDFDRALEDVFAIQSEIAKQVVSALQITLLAEEQTQIERPHTADIEAHNLYLKGLYFYNQGGTGEKSRKYFEQAIERDPGYAVAYAQLAQLYTRMPWQSNMPAEEAYAKARAAAEKALDLDDGLAEAHSALATVKVYADWDWSGAEQEFQKAIALNPNSALAHAEYGHKILSPVMGRYDNALAEMKRAQELDPLSTPISASTGYVYYHARRWDQSIAQFQQTLELGSKAHWPQIGIGQNYVQMGRYEAAIAAFDEAAALLGDFHWLKGVRGEALALAGRTDEAQQTLRELHEAAAKQKVDPIPFAYVYKGLGDHDRAITWLRKAYEEHSVEMIFLRTPAWDSLRSEPRFIELMKDVGLPID